MTVNEMLEHLRRAQRDGYGERPVYVHRDGDSWCLRAERVSTHHTTRNGHVVIRSEAVPQFDPEDGDGARLEKDC